MEKMRRFNPEEEIVHHPEALEKARKFAEANRLKIDGSFPDYDEESKKEDEKYVMEMKKTWRTLDIDTRVAKEKAEILEALIVDQIEKSGWLTDMAQATLTTEFDDIRNGIDSVVEFKNPQGGGMSSFVGMAIDVTFAKFIGDKVDAITSGIRKGRMGTVKYFRSRTGDFTGRLENVPRYVVGVDVDTLNQLNNLWVDSDKSSNAQEALRSHPVQMQILEELLMQAKYFQTYAERHKNEKAVKAYMHQEKIFQLILDHKKEKLATEEYGDRFLTGMKGFLDSEK